MRYGNVSRCWFATLGRKIFPSLQAERAYRDSLDHTRRSREDEAMRKLILVFLLGCAACTTGAQDAARAPAAASGAATAATTPADPAATLARLRAMAADATCTEHGQCRTVAVGANPCGGPQEYLPYSMMRTNEKDLLAVAERYKAERQAQNQASGMVSTCRYLPDPGAVCTSGSCQLGASSPAPR